MHIRTEDTKKPGRTRQRRPRRATAAASRGAYRRAHAAKQSRADSQSVRDIGELPPVADPQRRIECLRNFRLFNDTYFPARYFLPWSNDHLEVMRLMQSVATHGLSFTLAMERSCGKTTLSETLCIFALCGAYHLFLGLFGANTESAEEMSEAIKLEFETNDLLLADFPEICYPFRVLEGVAQRANGQTYCGKRTRLRAQTKDVILPSLQPAGWKDDKHLKQFLRPDGYCKTAGAGYKCKGLDSGFLGMKRGITGGQQIRPTLAVVNDPQTQKTADSDKECKLRLKNLTQGIRRLAGPGKKTAIVVTCTVFREGDLADQLLDTDTHPEFNGRKFKALYKFPIDLDKWEGRYSELRREGMADVRLGKIPAEDKLKKATAYYRRNRKAMRAGAEVAWMDLCEEGELDGLQRVMNLYLENRASFFAQCQQEPESEIEEREEILNVARFLQCTNGYDRGQLPDGCEKTVAYIDVQSRLLYWALASAALDFSGGFVDYGSFPDQNLTHFYYTNARKTLTKKYCGASEESRIFQGLQALIERLATTTFYRADGTAAKVNLILVDSGYKKQTVFSAIRQSPHAGICMPTKGSGIKSANRPMVEYKDYEALRRRGLAGPFWRIETDKEFRARWMSIDTNSAKTFLHARFAQPDGSTGAMRFYGRHKGKRVSATHHEMIAEHFASESATPTFGQGRELFEWKQPPSKPDNHLFDCGAGIMAGLSKLGCGLATDKSSARPKTKLKLSEIRNRKRRAR